MDIYISKLNKGADALSRRHVILAVLGSKVLGFKIVKDLYAQDGDFKEILEKSTPHARPLSLRGRISL